MELCSMLRGSWDGRSLRENGCMYVYGCDPCHSPGTILTLLVAIPQGKTKWKGLLCNDGNKTKSKVTDPLLASCREPWGAWWLVPPPDGTGFPCVQPSSVTSCWLRAGRKASTSLVSSRSTFFPVPPLEFVCPSLKVIGIKHRSWEALGQGRGTFT